MDITLKTGGFRPQTFTFATNDAAIKWAEEELKAWSGVLNGIAFPDQTRNGLIKVITLLKTAPDVSQKNDAAEFITWASRHQFQNQLNIIRILSTEPGFQAMKKGATEYPDCADLLAKYFMANQFPPANSDAGLMAQAIIGKYLLPKHKTSLVPQQKAFDTLTTKLKTRISNLDTKLNDIEALAVKRRADEEQACNDTMILAAQSVEDRLKHETSRARVVLRDTTVDAKAAIAEINATDAHFREKLSLDPAFTYWTTKAGTHETKAKGLLKYLRCAGGITAVPLMGGLITLITKAPNLGAWGETRMILVTGITLTLTTLLFWTARLMTRLYLGNVHLANDAHERAILIKTYLALNIDGKATEEDRALMLATVFRPSTDGVVRDDAAPIINPGALLGRGSG